MKFYEDLERAMQYYSTSGGFLTVKHGDKVNTMSVAWGYVGFNWNKPQFVALVRPQRYTHELIEKADSFTISIPYGTLKEELKICGTKSGRDIDKAGIVRFIPAKSVDSPVVEGCDRYFECKIQYAGAFDGEKMPEAIRSAMFKGDYHSIFIGEITESY